MMGVRRKILCIVGARPNFMKIAPIMRALDRHAQRVAGVLVHTGQHYDVAMNAQFFQQLRIPEPHVSLEVGSASHAVQTAEIMKRFEPILDEHAPDCVLVVGDVNSTIACALVAAKKGVKVVHVEAGLRSFDRSMPEELNRLLTDQLSDRLYTTEASAAANLAAEGIDTSRVVFAGNVMIDTLLASLDQAVPVARTLAANGIQPGRAGELGRYALLTLHRPSNVDQPQRLANLFDTLLAVADSLPIVFPVHPRTRARIDEAGLAGFLADLRVFALPPIGYVEMLGLTASATVVLTDSGGLQEETTALGVPCLTLRENTERPITIEQGTNTLVGTDPVAIRRGLATALAGGGKAGRRPELWDGRAAERIVDDLVGWLAAHP
jgi:UDP-N-acetylglucosamine 2-epimerase (non-hydrolysing)